MANKHLRLLRQSRPMTRVIAVVEASGSMHARDRFERGQAGVELALVTPIVLFVMLIGIQYALLGVAVLGLGQANYQGARYAATNPTASADTVNSYMVSVASPIISTGSGRYLTSSVTPTPCTFGSNVTVSVSFNAAHLVILPNPFFGISFPTTLTNSASAFCE